MDETLAGKETGASTVWPFSTQKVAYTLQDFTIGAILPELETLDYKESQRLLEKLGEKQERYPFWNMLVEYMPRSGFIPPTNRPIIIYDLACGYAKECAVLSSYFGRAPDVASEGTPNEVEIVAMDIYKRTTDEAKRAYKDAPNIKVREQDLASENWAKIDQLADIILLRRPVIHAYDPGGVWEKIIRNAVRYLKPNGIILITTYSEVEEGILISMLSAVGLKIVLSEKNKEALFTGSSHNSDTHVLVAKRKLT